MNTPSPNTASTKPHRAMRWALFVSLALNLLIVGVVAGTVLSGGPKRGMPPGERSVGAPYIKAFERSDRRAMRQEMRELLPDRRQQRAATKADFAQFSNLLRADEFDAAAARSLMEAQMARTADVLELGRDITISRISDMTPDARRAYADRLDAYVAEMGRKKGKKDK